MAKENRMTGPRAALSLALLAAGLLLAAAGQPLAHEFKAGSLLIDHPWARATPPGAKVAGGYMTIENQGSEADRLVSATAEVAGRVEFHESVVIDGIARMRPLENGLEIPAGGSVEFKPGSYHVMFRDLARPLKEGESFAGTLIFEKAGTIAVTYAVGPLGGSSEVEHPGAHAN